MIPQKRKAYSTEEKLAILDDYSKIGSTAIKEKYGVSKANLSKWKKQKYELVERVADGKGSNFKVKEDPWYEKKLLSFIDRLRESCIPVSGEVIQNEAIRLHKEALNNGENVPNDFVASSGFLSRFLKRNDIRNYTISGESSGVSSETIDQWNDELKNIIKSWDPECIYNLDESALFINILPNRTYNFKQKGGVHGRKRNVKRITMMLNTNMTGSDKRKLLIIGHFAKPRCFKNVTKLNVQYEHNSRAWMNSQIYNNYLENWNKELISQGKKVLLFQDQCPSHKLFKNYSNITVVNFKKNTTSSCQPLDAGIIKWVKQHYKKKLVNDIINRFNATENVNNESFKWEWNLLEAINNIDKSWKKLPPEIIKKCFVKCGFQLSGENVTINDSDDKDAEIDISSNQVQLFASIVNIGDVESFFELLNLDNDIPTSSIIDDLETNNLTGCNVDQNIWLEDEPIDDDPEIIPPSIEEVKNSFNLLKQYLMLHGESSLLEPVEEFLDKKCPMKQSLITDFFT